MHIVLAILAIVFIKTTLASWLGIPFWATPLVVLVMALILLYVFTHR